MAPPARSPTPVMEESGQTDEERRCLRQQQRELQIKIQCNAQAMENPCKAEFAQVREENNHLFEQVFYTREAVLDGESLEMISDHAAKQVNGLVQVPRYDATQLTRRLRRKCMRLNRFDWHELGIKVGPCFNAIPSRVTFLGGPLHADIVPKKAPGKRKRPQEQNDDDAKEEHPDIDTNLERNVDQLSAVDRNIHVLNKVLKQRSEQVKQEMDQLPPEKRPKGTQVYEVNAIQYMFDPHSFTQTVENMFHFSFLVKNGGARIAARPDGPKVASISRSVKKEPRQAIVCLTMQDWRDLCRAYNVHKPDVPHRTGSKQVHHFKEPSPVYPSNLNSANNLTAAASNEESAEISNEFEERSNAASVETDNEESVETNDAKESAKMAEPSYEDLEFLIAKMVHEVDLEKTSFRAFFALLSNKLGGIDLESRKGFIRKTLSDIIISMEGDDDHVNSDNDEGEEDVQPKKRRKTKPLTANINSMEGDDDRVNSDDDDDDEEEADVQSKKQRKTNSGGDLAAFMEGSHEESVEANRDEYAEPINDDYWDTIDDDESISFDTPFDQSTTGSDGKNKFSSETVGCAMPRIISGETSSADTTVGAANHAESVVAPALKNGVGLSVKSMTTPYKNSPESAARPNMLSLSPDTPGFTRLPISEETSNAESGERQTVNGVRSPDKSSTATQGGTYKYSSLTARLARGKKRKRRSR